jgi:hypothetical protein
MHASASPRPNRREAEPSLGTGNIICAQEQTMTSMAKHRFMVDTHCREPAGCPHDSQTYTRRRSKISPSGSGIFRSSWPPPAVSELTVIFLRIGQCPVLDVPLHTKPLYHVAPTRKMYFSSVLELQAMQMLPRWLIFHWNFTCYVSECRWILWNRIPGRWPWELNAFSWDLYSLVPLKKKTVCLLLYTGHASSSAFDQCFFCFFRRSDPGSWRCWTTNLLPLRGRLRWFRLSDVQRMPALFVKWEIRRKISCHRTLLYVGRAHGLSSPAVSWDPCACSHVPHSRPLM